jgi:hypothetical protein
VIYFSETLITRAATIPHGVTTQKTKIVVYYEVTHITDKSSAWHRTGVDIYFYSRIRCGCFQMSVGQIISHERFHTSKTIG